jgi:hypothetical protein
MSLKTYVPAPAASPNGQCSGRTPLRGHEFDNENLKHGRVSRRPYRQCGACGLVKWGS